MRLNPLTGLPSGSTSFNFPTVHEGTSYSILPQAASLGAGIGAVGSDGSSGPIDFASLINNDSLYKQMKADLAASGIVNREGAQNQIRSALTNYGAVPDLGNFAGNSGLLKGLDLNSLGQLAAKNTSEGTSLLARLQKTHEDNMRKMRQSLAARGMLSSGDLGFQTGEEEQGYKNSRSDAQRQIMDFLNQVSSGYAQYQNQIAAQIAQAAEAAARRQQQLLPDYVDPTPAPPQPAFGQTAQGRYNAGSLERRDYGAGI